MSALALVEPLIGNIDAEACLLGGLMQPGGQIDRVADILRPVDFTEPLHGRIFAAIIKEYSLGRPVTPITLKPYFDHDETIMEVGGVKYLVQLSGNPVCLLGAVGFAEQVAELASRRRLVDRLKEVIEGASDYEVPVDTLADEVEGALADATNREADATKSLSLGKCIGLVADGFNDDASGITCGVIPTLDHCLGPICAGDLVIIAARPAMGKTTLAQSYGIGAAKQGYGVMFASLEMRASQLGAKAACDLLFDTEMRVPYQAIVERTADEKQRRNIARAADHFETLPFHVEDLAGVTIGRLNRLVRRNVRRFAAKGQKLSLVVVDYLQLVRPDYRENNANAAISEVSRGLKQIAKEHDVAVMALAQLNREVEKRHDKRPMLADLRDSGQIEQDADAIVFLLRKEEYLQRERPDDLAPEYGEWSNAMREVEGKIEFIVAKRRFGRTGIGYGLWHGAYQAVRG